MAIAKPAGTWTYEDLFSLPDDGTRYEIIEGVLYEMPAPSWNHQLVITNLLIPLAPLVRALGGQIVASPLDVFFDKPVGKYVFTTSPLMQSNMLCS